MRARRADPPRDPDGSYHEAIAELARQFGTDVHDMLDDWSHQAAVYEYDASNTRAEAERRALDDVTERYRPRQVVLL